ncbi:hypothetical protein [Natrinema sp. 74]|uniref:hypothetical protein n=1 Tax=Natrinema sp. 74 TaxID=3384159 RepID=UPI0038D460A1
MSIDAGEHVLERPSLLADPLCVFRRGEFSQFPLGDLEVDNEDEPFAGVRNRLARIVDHCFCAGV